MYSQEHVTAVPAPVLPIGQHASLLVFLDCLDLQVFEDVDPAAAAEVGGRAGQGVLLQVELAQGYHEPGRVE